VTLRKINRILLEKEKQEKKEQVCGVEAAAAATKHPNIKNK